MRLTVSDWENACRRCGLCCYEKTIDDAGRVRLTNTPCRHLDPATRTCRVYDRRLEVEAECIFLTPDKVRTANWLPLRCGYRALLASRD